METLGIKELVSEFTTKHACCQNRVVNIHQISDIVRGVVVHPGERFDVIVSNPPYIPEGEKASLQPEVRDWEPEGALFAGTSGLDVVLPLSSQAPACLLGGGLFATEVGDGQAGEVARASASTSRPAG